MAINHDIVILDNPAYAIAPETKTYIECSDFNLFLIRNNFTSTKYLMVIDELERNVGKERLGIVLNEVPLGVNYSGKFYGSQYMYNRPKTIVNKLKHYWDSYKNAWHIE